MRRSFWAILAVVFHGLLVKETSGGFWNVWDIRYWRCTLKTTNQCSDNDVKFYLYTKETGTRRLRIDIRNYNSLRYSGFDPQKKNVIIIHGFNGTESKTPITTVRNAYLSRSDYNIFTVEWMTLTRFPCYLSALSNTRLVAQCTAKLYAFVMAEGGDARNTTCVGHSLGAHVCGMVSNHLDIKQHRIVGLDPARPLIDRFANKNFKLTKDDAHQVQIIHTNAGLLGETNQIGHVDFCVNGGGFQPHCRGNVLRRARCSHFQSACYFAQTVMLGNSIMGRPCSAKCPKRSANWGYLPGRAIPMGEDTPPGTYGTYCVRVDTGHDCPYFD